LPRLHGGGLYIEREYNDQRLRTDQRWKEEEIKKGRKKRKEKKKEKM
jgi:hypothetical protein